MSRTPSVLVSGSNDSFVCALSKIDSYVRQATEDGMDSTCSNQRPRILNLGIVLASPSGGQRECCLLLSKILKNCSGGGG